MPNTTRNARPGNPLVAVGYLRASTTDQRLSPEAQRAAIEAWAQREGASVVAWHCDAGISGGSDLADRPALVAALGELRALRAGVLVVAKRDRLARDIAVAALIERAAGSAGARIVSADGAGNGDSPSDALMRGMLDVFAAHERSVIRARTKAALQAKRAKGERAGTVPFGYTADASGRLSPCEAEQAVIDAVRSLRAAGMPFRAIEAELASRGLTSRSGRPFGIKQVFRMTKAAA